MKAPTLFDHAAEELEGATTLNRLEARGTLRIALKSAGFDANKVSASDFRVVILQVLPKLLTERGVESEERVCHRVAAALTNAPAAESPEKDLPEAIFKRLGDA